MNSKSKQWHLLSKAVAPSTLGTQGKAYQTDSGAAKARTNQVDAMTMRNKKKKKKVV